MQSRRIFMLYAKRKQKKKKQNKKKEMRQKSKIDFKKLNLVNIIPFFMRI